MTKYVAFISLPGDSNVTITFNDDKIHSDDERQELVKAHLISLITDAHVHTFPHPTQN